MIPARFAVCAAVISMFCITAVSCSGEKVDKPVVEQYVDKLGKAKKDAENVKKEVEKATSKMLDEADKPLSEAKKSLDEMERKTD
jgi:hypothetical protein